MEIKGYNTIDNKKHKLFNLPTYIIEMMNKKSSNRGLNYSEYVSRLVLEDDELKNKLNEIEVDIKKAEEVYKFKKDYFINEKERINKIEEKEDFKYFKEKERLYELKYMILSKLEEETCNNELLRPLAITILRNYLYNGGIEKAKTLLNSMSIANRINKNILEKEFNRVKGIYDTYNKKEKKEFENATRDLQELKTTKLPKGL